MNFHIVKREQDGNEIIETYYDLDEEPVNGEECEDPQTHEEMGYVKYTRRVPALAREKPVVEVGAVVGRYTILKMYTENQRGHCVIRCNKCGAEKPVRKDRLVGRKPISCACDASRASHGLTRTQLYRAVQDAKQRCTNPNNGFYADYGGRGIKFRLTPEDVLAEIGHPPKGMTLDRVEVNGNYERGNIKWSPPSEQRANRRDSPKNKRLLSLLPITIDELASDVYDRVRNRKKPASRKEGVVQALDVLADRLEEQGFDAKLAEVAKDREQIEADRQKLTAREADLIRIESEVKALRQQWEQGPGGQAVAASTARAAALEGEAAANERAAAASVARAAADEKAANAAERKIEIERVHQEAARKRSEQDRETIGVLAADHDARILMESLKNTSAGVHLLNDFVTEMIVDDEDREVRRMFLTPPERAAKPEFDPAWLPPVRRRVKPD